MAAATMDTFVLIMPNPEWPQTDADFDRAPSNISFSMYIDSNIRTLSTNTVTRGDDITGLLYVPDLSPNDPCVSQLKPFVPSNVTRQANLPNKDYVLVALAPWISADCTLAYLEAARSDPLRAFVFYLPDHNMRQPPPANDRRWNLDDGGQWKTDNRYPVYAIPGKAGQMLMNKLSHYSGNMTDVDFGHELTQHHDSRDYARLYTEISTGSRDTLPSLWVFLLIVLAILVTIVGATSLAMHWMQKQHRQALRRRVANGEVDLEALGIKRLRVPPDILEAMPLSAYVASADSSPRTATHPVPSDDSYATSKAPSSKAAPARAHTLSQPTCAICLDDFVPLSCIVRELPCAHIFHSECVDDFLLSSSSLCPMCKKSVLPHGHCPLQITNSMVRRERNIRRMRERVMVSETTEYRDARPPLPGGVGVRMASFHQMFKYRQRQPATRQPHDGAVTSTTSDRGSEETADSSSMELAQQSASPRPLTPSLPQSDRAQSNRAPTAGREEWARRRANEMIGFSSSSGDTEDERQQVNLPKC